MVHVCTVEYSARRSVSRSFFRINSICSCLNSKTLEAHGTCKLACSRLRRHFANIGCDKPPNIKGWIHSKEEEASGQTYSECRKIGPPPATGSFMGGGFFAFCFRLPAFCFPSSPPQPLLEERNKNKQIPHDENNHPLSFDPRQTRERLAVLPIG